MSTALPPRPNLDWLRKTARQQLKAARLTQPDATLSDVQFELARKYGFSSWRSLKAHVDETHRLSSTAAEPVSDEEAAAFLKAVGSGQIDIVRAALQMAPRLASVIGPHPYWDGRPQPLHIAIETARGDVFDLLLTAGADVNGSNEEYEHSSPLMLTFLWRQPEMRQELIRRNARIGLVEALLAGDDGRVGNLLRQSDPRIPHYRPNGGSILAMARTPFAIDRLLELGAPRDLPDRWGSRPLDALSRLGREGLPLVSHLLGKGFQAGEREYARLGDLANLKRLLASHPGGVDVGAVLRDAAGFGHEEVARWALSQGADVNSQENGKGWTALHSAAWEGNLSMAKLLVEAGADVQIVDGDNRSTPADTARVAITVTNNPACGVVADYLDTHRTS
ncbi:MAG TPA: ankyrin repeat domain-containing protein [Steroidobacteraceae bacterium]|jgi:hypothetical protein